MTGLSETYDSKNAGSGKTLAVATGYSVNDGNGGGNYTVTTVTSTAGVIDQAGVDDHGGSQHQDLRRYDHGGGHAHGRWS